MVANNNGQYQQFTSVNPEECLLMVPESAIVDYILAPVWGAYGNMQLHNLKYYTLTTLSSDASMGYTSTGRSYVANSVATIYAYANGGYAFKQWSDGNMENPRSLIVTSDTNVSLMMSNADITINPVAIKIILIKDTLLAVLISVLLIFQSLNQPFLALFQCPKVQELLEPHLQVNHQF
jgi:hypothetical protein